MLSNCLPRMSEPWDAGVPRSRPWAGPVAGAGWAPPPQSPSRGWRAGPTARIHTAQPSSRPQCSPCRWKEKRKLSSVFNIFTSVILYNAEKKEMKQNVGFAIQIFLLINWKTTSSRPQCSPCRWKREENRRLLIHFLPSQSYTVHTMLKKKNWKKIWALQFKSFCHGKVK